MPGRTSWHPSTSSELRPHADGCFHLLRRHDPPRGQRPKITSELVRQLKSHQRSRTLCLQKPAHSRSIHVPPDRRGLLQQLLPPGLDNILVLVRSKRKDLEMRHIRRDPLLRRTSGRQKLEKSSFCDNTAICHITASPSPPMIDVRRMCAPGTATTPLRLVILEGFASGTYPTQKLEQLRAALIRPLQARHPDCPDFRIWHLQKQQSYDVELVRGVNVPVMLMNGLTIETALRCSRWWSTKLMRKNGLDPPRREKNSRS